MTQISTTSLPLRMYGFGTIPRWRNVGRKAIAEGILANVGKVTTTLSDAGVVVYAVNVLGQSGVTWYEVRIERTADALLVGCACQAGRNEKPCKHIAAVMILKGWIQVPEEVRKLPLLEPDRLEWDLTVVEFVRRGMPS